MSFLHLRELNATERSSRTTRQTGQGLFCIGTAAAGTEQRDLERKLLVKQPKGRPPQRSYKTGRHLASSIW